jgi:hypothetical protein
MHSCPCQAWDPTSSSASIQLTLYPVLKLTKVAAYSIWDSQTFADVLGLFYLLSPCLYNYAFVVNIIVTRFSAYRPFWIGNRIYWTLFTTCDYTTDSCPQSRCLAAASNDGLHRKRCFQQFPRFCLRTLLSDGSGIVRIYTAVT